MALHPAPKGFKSVPFDPISFLSGGASLPSLGGDAGPAVSESSTGFINASSSISAPFIIGDGNKAAGGGSGALTSSNLVWLAAIGGAAWLIFVLRK